MGKFQNVECRALAGRKVRFLEHRKGFTAYSLEEGEDFVITLSMEERNRDTSARLARELLIVVREKPPLHQELTAESWIKSVLYKFGGPEIQFESQECSGTVMFKEIEGEVCHGSINLTFTSPNIDRAEFGQASLKADF